MTRFRVLSQSVISLMPAAPGAAGATATAALDFNDNTVEIIVAGLPKPSTFGRDVATGKLYNVYEAWLLDTSENLFASIGVMTLDGSEYRIKAQAPLPLREFNAIAITPEDRSGPQTVNGPFIIMGTFREVVRDVRDTRPARG